MAAGSRLFIGYVIVLDSARASPKGDLALFVSEHGPGANCVGQQ